MFMSWMGASFNIFVRGSLKLVMVLDNKTNHANIIYNIKCVKVQSTKYKMYYI